MNDLVHTRGTGPTGFLGERALHAAQIARHAKKGLGGQAVRRRYRVGKPTWAKGSDGER